MSWLTYRQAATPSVRWSVFLSEGNRLSVEIVLNDHAMEFAKLTHGDAVDLRWGVDEHHGQFQIVRDVNGRWRISGSRKEGRLRVAFIPPWASLTEGRRPCDVLQFGPTLVADTGFRPVITEPATDLEMAEARAGIQSFRDKIRSPDVRQITTEEKTETLVAGRERGVDEKFLHRRAEVDGVMPPPTDVVDKLEVPPPLAVVATPKKRGRPPRAEVKAEPVKPVSSGQFNDVDAAIKYLCRTKGHIVRPVRKGQYELDGIGPFTAEEIVSRANLEFAVR